MFLKKEIGQSTIVIQDLNNFLEDLNEEQQSIITGGIGEKEIGEGYAVVRSTENSAINYFYFLQGSAEDVLDANYPTWI